VTDPSAGPSTDPSERTDPAEVDLDVIGALVRPPDVRAEDDARAHLGEDRLASLGTLGQLAVWWAGVRADSGAGPAEQVDAVGLASSAAAARCRGSIRAVALDPPADVAGALRWGLARADDAADRGVQVLLLAVDDAPAGRLLCAELMGLDAVEASGWPTERGVSDEEWMARVEALRDGLHRTRGRRGRPADLLAAIGSPRLAAATSLALQAAVRHTPVLLDGPAATAAALLARRCAWDAATWWRAAHQGGDPLHARALASLTLQPLTELGLTVEDGVGALAGLAVLDLAAAQLG
jgi:nicotinate-nucleotide--dimethylbenzimidazole phosphoribosyltransferase